MAEKESSSLEYLREVFRGLDTEKKNRVLNTARSLLEVQEDNNCLVNNHTHSNSKKETIFSDSFSAWAEKI